MVSAELIRIHFDYTSWATGRLLAAAAELTPEELTRDFHTADKSVLGTLAHVFAADRVWLSRIEGTPRAKFIGEEDHDLVLLRREWPALYDRWMAWATRQTDASVGDKCKYRDMKSNEHESPLWQIALHVVNHGTHHRGQVSGFLRAMGKVPPPLDLIAYYRQKSAAH